MTYNAPLDASCLRRLFMKRVPLPTCMEVKILFVVLGSLRVTANNRAFYVRAFPFVYG